ncbi:MAG: M3 family oligoendopeptidase [Acetobacteraceae bacterium]|nr:M3 family oligoendopeptidase [Acetobacteraceae bacterium]
MIQFDSISAPTPDKDGLNAAYALLNRQLDRGDLGGALAAWDGERRSFETWSALVHLRFAQNTADAEAKSAREYADALAPEVADLETMFKRRLLADTDREGLMRAAGAHAVRLWETDVTAFDPAIKPDLEEESRLSARYSELLASASLSIGGQTVNLAGLAPFAEDPDRAIRHEAERVRWEFFSDHGTELDTIYHDLVQLRHGMARKLGFSTYTPLGYRRMRRVDYGPEDVARYREQVVTHVVPLVARLLEQRRTAHGWDKIRYWDEALIDPAGNPRPAGGHDFLVAQARKMFDGMHGELGAFFREMDGGGFLDLRNRPAKRGGGFCTSFPTVGMPFIFANFTGTHHDIGVFTHEMGHAFQNHMSKNLPNVDYLWPTMEAAEIHSMSLEFLTWPFMELLVGDAAADRFRRMHLTAALSFLPYGVCVDHFQHEVFANPDASPNERHAIWRRLEQHYMPWTDHGDLAWPAKGGRWQAKPHIYGSPFYYIDYTLAQCCALQFWSRARRDPKEALDAYVGLCGLGGSAPFQELVSAAGLISPFADGALADVAREAEAFLAG